MTLVPSVNTSIPRLLNLTYYRTESDGWKASAHWNTCYKDYKRTLIPFCRCTNSINCSCNICRRQSPSLRDLAANVVYKYSFNLEHSELTQDMTYDLYVYAVNSKRFYDWKLLPPEYPRVDVNYHYCCPRPRL
jgi:hypothetical protein